MGKKEAIRDLMNISKPSNKNCKSCQVGKKIQVPFKSNENASTSPYN